MSNITLKGSTISDTYPSILQVNNLSGDLGAVVEDGIGNISPLTVYKSGSNNSIKMGELKYPISIENNNRLLKTNNNLLQWSKEDEARIDGNKIIIGGCELPQDGHSSDGYYIFLNKSDNNITTKLKLSGDLQIYTPSDSVLLGNNLNNITEIPNTAKIYQIWLMGYVGNSDTIIKNDNNPVYTLNKFTVFYDILMMSGATKNKITITEGIDRILYITQISYTLDRGAN